MPEKTSKEMYYLCFILMYTTFYTKVLSYFIKTTTRSIGFLKKSYEASTRENKTKNVTLRWINWS